ncbi:MAG TPA: AIPR family protein, partial [Candidatus Obscuribacterales bacterium]
ARGQYAEERSRANRKQLESKYPPENMFTKTDLAKFENSWHQLPHLVSRGAQKNFTEFDRRFVKKQKVTANETYFKELVAKAILFREANTIIKKQQFGGHVNSILTFTIALLCRLLEFDGTVLNLEKIWKQQALSAELKSELEKLSIHVHKAIMESAGNQNVGEWCKKEECWLYIRDLNISKLVLHDTDVVPLPPEELSAPNNEEDTEEADDSVFSQSTI